MCVRYGWAMEMLRGTKTPSPHEIELYHAAVYDSAMVFPRSTGVAIERIDGFDNDTINVYCEGQQVFNITFGVSDQIGYYIPGPWEDVILHEYHRFVG